MDYKEKLQELVDGIMPEFKAIQIRASNIQTFADIHGLSINWEKGIVSKENEITKKEIKIIDLEQNKKP